MKRSIIVLFAIVFLVACQKPNLDEVVNLNGNEVMILGHGGLGIGGTYEMNSLESINKCIALGASGTEIDVQMTRDCVLVAYHGVYLEDDLNGEGLVNEKSYAEIKDLLYSDLPYQRYRLIRVEEVFQHLSNYQELTFTFDCKFFPRTGHSEYKSEFQKAVLNLMDKYSLRDNVLIESTDEDFLLNLKAEDPNLRLYVYADFKSGLAFAEQNAMEGITLSTTDITREDVALAHSKGLKIATWNTHSKKRNREALEKHPDYIQTDMVEYLLKITGNKK